MKSPLFFLAIAAVSLGTAMGQSYTSTSATGLWNSNRWNNTSDAAPYTSAWVANNDASFTSGSYTFSGANSSGAVNVGNITLADNVTVSFTGSSGTLSGNGSVRTVEVGMNAVIDFGTQAFSTTSGNGWIKDGSGILALAGGEYNGGFTLNDGTVIARGVNAFGANASNVLTLNGGTVASNANRSFTAAKHGGGIVIGGNVQFGELATVVSLASSSANLSFANDVSLGAANRTLTLGNNGTHTFSGIISNASGGITFAANSGTGGRFDITNAANTFTGDITITGGEVRFTSDGSLGNAANGIIIDGGRFATASGATFALGAGRNIAIGDAAGTSISTPGSGTLTINTAIADITGKTGSWAKQGEGTLELGGANTYTGGTTVSAGTLVINNTSGSGTGTGNVVVQDTATLAGVGTLRPASGGTILFEDGSTVSVGTSGATTGQQLSFIPDSGTITTTFETGSTLVFDLFSNVGDNTSISAAADRLFLNGSAVFQNNVTLRVNTALDSLLFAYGDAWKLLDWSSLSFTGTTDDLNLELPTLSGGLSWNTSQLFTTGNVTIIPEPSRAVLAGLGLLALAFRRRR